MLVLLLWAGGCSPSGDEQGPGRQRSSNDECRISCDVANLRAGPGLEHAVVGSLTKGAPVHELARSDALYNDRPWLKVGDDPERWVWSGLVTCGAPAEAPSAPSPTSGYRAGADFRPPTCSRCVGVKGGLLWDYEQNREFLAFGSNVPSARIDGLPGHITGHPELQVVRVLASGGNMWDRHDKNYPPESPWKQEIADQLAQLINGAPGHLRFIITFADYYRPLPAEKGALIGDNNPGWCGVPVRPWPWYLKSPTKSFHFRSACGGELQAAPNYEAHYKPFVGTVVQTLMARVPQKERILGYTLLNEWRALARGGDSSTHEKQPGHVIFGRFLSEMYAYIRSIDRNSLVFPGAISLAHVSDDHGIKWTELAYRAQGNQGEPPHRTYEGAWKQALSFLAANAPFNAWSMSLYDLEPEIKPDIRAFRDRRIPVVMTEVDFNGYNHESSAPGPKQKPFPDSGQLKRILCHLLTDGPEGQGVSLMLNWAKEEMRSIWGNEVEGQWNDGWYPAAHAIASGVRHLAGDCQGATY
jgi:hypothetical protein